MQNRVVKSEPIGGWGTVAGPCPGCLTVNLVSQGATLAGPNTPVPLHLPGCPSQNAWLYSSQRNDDDDDVIFVETPTNVPLQPTVVAGNLQGRTMSSDEDDLLVTFVTLPETAHYPHARGDCKIHNFKEVDLTTIGPVENNATYCDKCYCFMCDVPANQCQQWTNPAGAHCNAYKCPAWLAQQTSKPSHLLSRLTVELITQEVRDAVRRTDELVRGIQEEYVEFRKGKPCLCTCHQLVPGTYACEVCKPHHTLEQYDYSLVRQKLLDAVKEAKAESQAGRGDAGMVVLDSLIHVLVLEKSPPTSRPNRNVGYNMWETKFYQSRNEIMKEIDELLMDIFVLVKTTPALRKAVIANLTEMLNREGVRHPWALSIRQWEDRLLSLVLTGANLTGRKNNDVLLEHCMVIRRRVERLKQDGNYRQAVRYLKCVNIPAHNLVGVSLNQERAQFLQLQHQVPMLYVRCGSFNEAFMTLASGPVDAKHLGDSIIAKMDGGAFLELMKSLSTSLCGVKGLPSHKILWACLVALTMNVGVQLNLEFLIWFVQWAARNTVSAETPCHDEAACNRARSLIQTSQKGLLTLTSLRECTLVSKLIMTASEAVLYPLFAHRHDAHLDRVVSAFGTKIWAFECSLNSCTLSSVFASTHLCQWLRKKYLPQYGASRLRDTTWSNILISAPQPVAAALIEDMLNISPPAYPTIFSCLVYFTAKLLSVPSAKVDKRLLAVFSTQIFPMAKAADQTTLLSNIVKLSFFNDPNEATVLALRDLYVKAWPKELDSMIRLLPPEKMEVALVSCFATCVRKGEVDIVVRMLHANRAGHPSTKTDYDYVPTVSVLLEKLAGQLTELDADAATQLCESIKDWLRDESYSPLLCQNCNYDIPLISLNKVWKSVGSICPDRLEHILAHAMKRLGKALTTFHMVKQAQRVSIVSWLKRVATVLKQFGKNVEYQVHLSFLISAISTKRGLVKEIQNCPELAADIIPSWMLKEWEGKYVRSMSEWSVKSSGPTKLTFRKTVSPGPVSPVAATMYNKGSSPDVQGPGSQLSHAPTAAYKAGVSDTTTVHQSLKESNNNVRAPGVGMKNLKNMSLEEILQYTGNYPSQSMVNGEAVHPVTSRGGSPGNLQVANQPADARYTQRGTPDGLNGMVQPNHYNSNSASQALHMVASRRQLAMANSSSQPSPLENQQMATTSAVPPLAGSSQRLMSAVETSGSSTVVSSAGSNLLQPPPPLISDAGNRPQTDQVPLLPPHSNRPAPPHYEDYMRSLQNSEVTNQPLPPQSSGNQSVANAGRPLDRMANFVNSLVPSSSQAQTMTPYQLIQPRRYPIEYQQMSTGQILNGIPQGPMQPSGGSSSAATVVSQSQPVQPGGQFAPQQCSTTALPVQQHGRQPQLQNVQSQMAAATTRTLTPEVAPVQLQPAGSTAVGLTTHSFQNAAIGVSMPVSSAQLPRFPTTSEPVHVFIPNVHQNLGNGLAVPMSVVHHLPSPQPFVVSSHHLQAVHPVSVSSSLHSIAQQLPLTAEGTLGPVGQQTGSHADTVLQTPVPQPVQVSVADPGNTGMVQQETQASVSAQDKGPVPVHVTFIPPPTRQEEEEVESEDDYTFDTTMPSPPRNLEIDDVVIISDSEEETETSDITPDDDSQNKEDQRQDDLPENDSSLSPEQSLAPENSETDTQPEDVQQTLDEEPLLNMSCESIDSDADERRTVRQPGKGVARENVVTAALDVQENISLSERAQQANAYFSKSPEENGVELVIQENTLSSERMLHASTNLNESNKDHDQNETEHTQGEEDFVALENYATTEPEEPAITNFMDSNKSHDQNGTEHTQDEELIVALENNSTTESDPANAVFMENNKNYEENEVERTQGEEEIVALENNATTEPEEPAITNFMESNKSHDQYGTRHTQDEEQIVALDNNANTESDPANANFMETKNYEENGVEHTQGEEETVALEDNATTEPEPANAVFMESNEIHEDNEVEIVVPEHNASPEPGQSEMESVGGSSIVANSDIIVVSDDVASDTDNRGDDNGFDNGFEQTSYDKGNVGQIEEDNSSVQDQCTIQDHNLTSAVCLENPAHIPSKNLVVQQADDCNESSGIEKPYLASDNSQLEKQTMVNTHIAEKHQPKETDNQISTAVARVVARLVIDVVKTAQKSPSKSPSSTQVTTNNDVQLAKSTTGDIDDNSQTSSSTEKAAHKDSRAGKKRKAESHVNDVVKKTKKIPTESDASLKKTKKIPTESDAKEATGNSTKHTSGNAKENRKVALEKGSKDVRPNNLNTVERRVKVNRAHSEQSKIRATHTKNGKMLNSAGKTVDLTRRRSEKVEGSHLRSSRKDRESGRQDRESGRQDRISGRQDRISGRQDRESGRQDRESGRDRKDRESDRKDRESGRQDRESGRQDRESGRKDRESGRKDRESGRKDGLVSLEIMAVDESAQANVTVQELRTVRCNVTFEERKLNKTAKEKPSSRSMGAQGKKLRKSSFDDTAKERNALRRWLERPTKERSSGPSKTALIGKKQNVLLKKRILDRSKMPPGIKLPRGLKLKKFPVVRLERIDIDRHIGKPRLRRSRSQPT